MINKLKTPLGRLRMLGYLEGISLLILVFAAVPLKHWAGDARLVKALGPVHGALFLWYVFSTLGLAVEQNWQFKRITWKVLFACMVPFGTFYIGKYIFSELEGRNS